MTFNQQLITKAQKGEIADFEYFPTLFVCSKVKQTKSYERILYKEARIWFDKWFHPVFGSTTRCDTKNKVTWHYSCGLLMFGFPGLGDYYFAHIIKMIHFEKWKLKEWREGYKYGKLCSTSKMKLRNNNYRDGNPYPPTDFYRSIAWDAGYIMGLHKFSFKKYIQIIPFTKNPPK